MERENYLIGELGDRIVRYIRRMAREAMSKLAEYFAQNPEHSEAVVILGPQGDVTVEDVRITPVVQQPAIRVDATRQTAEGRLVRSLMEQWAERRSEMSDKPLDESDSP